MNTKLVVALTVAAVLAAGSLFVARAQTEPKATPPDPRIDKLLEQNEKVLKSQEDILKKLDELKEGLLQVRRRSS
jgi:hypothetical protein